MYSIFVTLILNPLDLKASLHIYALELLSSLVLSTNAISSTSNIQNEMPS